MKLLQRGAALLILMIVMVMAGLTYVVANLSPEVIAARRAQKTNEALVQARDALIGYAVQYREQQAAHSPPDLDAMYGHLPPPDLGNLNGTIGNCKTEGCSTVNPAAIPNDNQYIVGRIPWQTLGIGPIRDGHSECLWYAVSATHRSVDQVSAVMNWDTLSTPDIAIGSNKTNLLNVGAHDKPVAVIFSPGPPFDQGRTPSTDAPLCGGNYDQTHYVDAALVNNSQRALAITPSMLFGAIRQNANFRTDINSMLDRMVSCLRDDFAATPAPAFVPVNPTAATDKIAGRIPDSACYDDSQSPSGYYSHYKELFFAAKGNPGLLTVNGDTTCKGVLMFSGQRDTETKRCPQAAPTSLQLRTNTTEKDDQCNYLEGSNLSNFVGSGATFAGAEVFDRPPNQSAYQDVVKCIPSSKSFVEASSLLPEGKKLAYYNPSNRTIELGNPSVSSADSTTPAANLFGCSWMPETHSMGSGFRSYFKFKSHDLGGSNKGHGFVYAIADGKNSTNVCGASEGHLGYSGGGANPIAPPKIGIEIDTAKQSTGSTSRGDPASCDNGHFGIVYWGDDLVPDDDNKHGAGTSPQNPPNNGAAVMCIPNDDEEPVLGRTFHARVEVTLVSTNIVARTKTYKVEAWFNRQGISETETPAQVAMKNTTRPLAAIYPSINSVATYLTDQPTIHDTSLGIACTADTPCTSGVCDAGVCVVRSLDKIRLGFTNAQGTASKVQFIEITHPSPTWLP